MDHNLGKQLKEAGFISNGQAWCEELKEVLPVPTLEELIEALPEGYCGLTRYKERQWVANCGWHETYENAAGETAVEAVAKLWLILKQDGQH